MRTTTVGDRAPRVRLGPEQIPNVLTAMRMAVAVAFPFVGPAARIAFLVLALVTEYLDGALARRCGWETELGRLLDPIADKLLFAMVAGTYLLEGRLTWFDVLAVAVRDVTVATGVTLISFLRRWHEFRRMKPGIFGKATTVLQYAILFVVVLGWRLPLALVLGTLVCGTAAALQYIGWFVGPGARRRAAEGS